MAVSITLAVSLLLALLTIHGQPASATILVAWSARGYSGHWIIDIQGAVYFREGTYGKPESNGDRWTKIPGEMRVLTVGRNVVWGINYEYEAFYRAGISKSNPKGNKWVKTPGKWQYISVSPTTKNHVWGTTPSEEIFVREVAKDGPVNGAIWKSIPGRMKQVSVGHVGVWAVDRFHNVYYRSDSFDDSFGNNTWVKVPGHLMYIHVGEHVEGIDRLGTEYLRKGVISTNPTGAGWIKYRQNQSFRIINAFF